MRRPSFLTVFFTILGVVFVIALVLRIRAYEAMNDPLVTGSASASTAGDSTLPTEAADAPADGTMVEAEVDAGAVARSRQEKLDQLLRSAPPRGAAPGRSVEAAPPAARTAPQAVPKSAPPPPERSLAQRVGGAVAAIFGGSGSGSGRSETASRSPRGPREQPDADSDVKPPQLIAVEFNPPQIKDGETTVLTIVASDDLAGVASVTGVINSPSGSVQGFACQREGETNRYVTRIAVPRDAPDGVWRINHISLADLAKNGAMLGAAQGHLPATASFRVTSARSDSTAPTLKALWLDQLVMRVGEPNRLYVQAEDDKSGVSAVTGVFVSPARTARLSFGCSGRPDGTWECPLSPPKCLDCGRWQLEQIQLHDKANNMGVLRTDQPMVNSIQLDIIGDQCDSGTPVLSVVSVQPLVVSNAEATTVTVTAMLTDDTCGVASVSGNAIGPSAAGSPRIYFTFTRGAEGQPWTAQIGVPKHAASGSWRIATVQVVDRGQNLKVYNEADRVLSGVGFRVQ